MPFCNKIIFYFFQAISKIHWDDDPDGSQWTIFAGGMPRASYGDKFTVTVQKGDLKHSVFDLTSKIVDFAVVSSAEEIDSPKSLLILAEEEIAAVDLSADHWPLLHHLPYLNPIHASSITSLTHMPDVKEEVFNKLKTNLAKISPKAWPINGGELEENASKTLEVMITGHEDGSVKFWNSTGEIV